MFGGKKKAKKAGSKERMHGIDRYNFASMDCTLQMPSEKQPYEIKVISAFVVDHIVKIKGQDEFEASVSGVTISLNLLSGLVTLAHEAGLRQSARLWAISPVETVNGHQWTGLPPAELRFPIRQGSGGGIRDTARPMWDLASVDHRSGRRLLWVRTHSRRDAVFMVNNRLNMFFNHAREVLEPWQEDMIEYLNQDSPDHLKEKAIASLPERLEAWGSPDWDWSKE